MIMMDIDRINKKHYVETDMYYRVEMGLSSKLLKYENGIFHIEVVVSRKWSRNLSAAAAEMAYAWRDGHEELGQALGCKVYMINARTNEFKNLLLDSDIQPTYDARKGVLFYKQHLN